MTVNMPERVHYDNFHQQMTYHFDAETADKIIQTLGDLNLPVPETHVEYFDASKGALLFLDDYACTIRIEESNAERARDNAERGYVMQGRRVDHPLVLETLGSIDAGKATIEIVPGIKTSQDEELSLELKDILADDGVDYWDDAAMNIGILPLKTVDFPEGVPVVLDRLSVDILSTRPKEIMRDFAEKEFQSNLYAPAQNLFNDAVAAGKAENKTVAPQKIQAFWDKCQEMKSEHKLFPGWQYYEDRSKLAVKQQKAIDAGFSYTEKTRKHQAPKQK